MVRPLFPPYELLLLDTFFSPLLRRVFSLCTTMDVRLVSFRSKCKSTFFPLPFASFSLEEAAGPAQSRGGVVRACMRESNLPLCRLQLQSLYPRKAPVSP